jgi:CheY-like chemotaxis protein
MRRLKILLVEDDADERALYGYMLAVAGYKVKAVSNGLEALAEIQVKRPDMIITGHWRKIAHFQVVRSAL